MPGRNLSYRSSPRKPRLEVRPSRPLVATAGNVYFGLRYPIVVALLAVVIGVIFPRNTKHANLDAE